MSQIPYRELQVRPLVLVVEDEAGIANAMSLTLRGVGFTTCEVRDLAHLNEVLPRSPVAVILDLSLGHSDGIEVVRELARAQYRGSVQLVSGSPQSLLDDARRVGQRHGLFMLQPIRKPFRMREIRQAMLSLPPATSVPRSPTVAEHRTSTHPEVDLDLCLANGWVEFWYQPKFDLRSDCPVGIEALARVRHPELGLLLPRTFIPSAGPASLARLTEFAIERVCADWSVFRDAGFVLRPALNITAEQLVELPLAEMIRRHAPADRCWKGLILEVMEDDILRRLDDAHEAATRLAIYDVTLSIDDFGMGYSSLARIRQFPFQEIKLDRSLVDRVAGEPTQIALCRAVIDLAHALGATVVAEGLERVEDVAQLKALGCDQGQGFALGHPKPAAELAKLLASGTSLAEKVPVEVALAGRDLACPGWTPYAADLAEPAGVDLRF